MNISKNNDTKKLKHLIDCHEIISFDIFDTLLLRAVANPKHLWDFVENKCGLPGFSYERDRIYKNLRKEGKEPDLQEIYAAMPKHFGAAQTYELQLEYTTQKANQEMVPIYRYALEQGKRVICVSDMHLDEVFLAKLLRNNGFDHFSKLYVSCRYGCRKSNDLFQKVIKEEGCRPEQILHIGDRFKSDKKQAEFFKIDTFWYQSPFMKIASDKLGKKLLYISLNNPTWSVILGLWQQQLPVESTLNEWKCIGGLLAGCICVGFAQFCHKIVEKSKYTDIFFLARDGYLIQKTMQILYPEASQKSHYIYVPRTVSYVLNNNTGKHGVNTLFELYRSIHPEELDNDSAKWKKSQKIQFVHNHVNFFEHLRQRYHLKFNEYIQNIRANMRGNQVLLIDGVSGEQSAQRLCSHYLPDCSIFGAYWKTCITDSAASFSSNETEAIYPLTMFERILSSPELPVVDINTNGAVYQKANEYNQYISKEFKQMEDAALQFIRNFKDAYGTDEIHFSYKEIVALCNFYLNHMTADRYEQFEHSFFGTGAMQCFYGNIAQKVWKPLLSILGYSLLYRKNNHALGLALKNKSMMYRFFFH